MSKREKRLALFVASPAKMKLADLIAVLADFGIFLVKNNGGSHQKFRGNGVRIILPIHNGDCEGIYKEEARDILIKKGLITK